MRTVLHIVTKPDDALARDMIARQRELPDITVEVVTLPSEGADYSALLDRIFEADSVQVW